MNVLSGEIAKIVGGELFGRADLEVTGITIDSRQSTFNDKVAFVAIRGKNHDGHDFVTGLFYSGIKTFIVEVLPDAPSRYPDTAFIVVEDSITALQDLAYYNRTLFMSPVIAVTGSTGKTIVKEWLANVFSTCIPVIRSPRSYNSQVGVPLSLLKLDEKYKIAIIEAGISKPGEMEKLVRIISPEIGVITNIGEAHSENFNSLKQKAEEKLELFSNSNLIIYCRDYKILHDIISNDKKYDDIRIVDWSYTDESAAVVAHTRPKDDKSSFIDIDYKGKSYEFTIPFTDFASVENAITTATVCLAMDLHVDIIAKGLSLLSSIAMRMGFKNGINGCKLIEDYYNSDPGSFRIAVESLELHNGSRSKTLILSDFIQSGKDNPSLYKEVAELISKAGINKFIGIGEDITRNRNCFSSTADSAFFKSTEAFISNFNPASFKNEVVLLKGARNFEFERIGFLLEQQVYQTILEVNLDAIANNLSEFRSVVKPGTHIMVMVKAFAYGAGAAEISEFLEYHRVSYLGVANVDEGVELRNADVHLPTIVMNPDPASLELLVKNNLEPVIYSFESLNNIINVAYKHGLLHYPVHIEIDTGMHRLGFLPDEVRLLAAKLSDSEYIKVASVFSHFAASEDPSMDDFSHKQARLFKEAASIIEDTTGYPVIKHICNSAGTARFPQYQFDMVRPGIGIYGVGRYDNLKLKNVGRFITHISQIKWIPAGEPVGYNCKDVADTDRAIAVLPVGYADGLNRKLGNRRGKLFVKNHFIPIVGNICMDACMADVTGLDVANGDEVEIFGDNIPIDELAETCETIPYEILTSIPHRVKRVFFKES